MTIVDGVLLQLIVTEEGNDFCGGVLELTIVMVFWNGLWEGSVNYAKTMSSWKKNYAKTGIDTIVSCIKAKLILTCILFPPRPCT